MVEQIKLSADTYRKLLDAERGLTDVVAELSKAEKCGIDCQGYRVALQNQLASIAAMKANYSPLP